MGEVKLFTNLSTPITLRIVWALKLKGIEYEPIYEDLDKKSSLLLEYNPIHKKVPVLLHNGKPVCEPLVILEYIDEIWNKVTRFLPEDPLARASARFWAKFCDEQVMLSFYNYCLTHGKDQEAAGQKTLENLKIVEEHLKGKKFFNGETFGYLDLVFGWMACIPDIVKNASNLKLLDKDTFPNIYKWKERFSDIPVIKENWPNEEAIILRYQRLRQARGIPISTEFSRE